MLSAIERLYLLTYFHFKANKMGAKEVSLQMTWRYLKLLKRLLGHLCLTPLTIFLQ